MSTSPFPVRTVRVGVRACGTYEISCIVVGVNEIESFASVIVEFAGIQAGDVRATTT